MPADPNPLTVSFGASGDTTLDNHQRFGRTTLVAVLVLAGVLTTLLSVAGRERAAIGLLAGALVACTDAYMLSRTLSRFARNVENIRARALTAAMMSRFLTIGGLATVLIAVGGLDAIGVLAGLLLLPVAIVGVALWAQSGQRMLRRSHDAAAR